MRSLRKLKSRRGAVAFVTYHRVMDAQIDPHQLAIRPEEFARHLAAYAERYTMLTAGEVFARINSNRTSGAANRGALPRNGLVVTIDDGYADMFTAIAPLLEAAQMPATFFVSSGLSSNGSQLDCQPIVDAAVSEATLSREQLASLAANPLIEIGGHTCSHHNLAQCNPAQLEAEITGDKRALEEITGSQITSFCYPYGTRDAISPAVMRAVKEAGYLGACTTLRGGIGNYALPYGALYFSSDPYLAPRLHTNGRSLEAILEDIDKVLAL